MCRIFTKADTDYVFDSAFHKMDMGIYYSGVEFKSKWNYMKDDGVLSIKFDYDTIDRKYLLQYIDSESVHLVRIH